MIRSLVSMRTPIISSFSTSYELMLDKLMGMSYMKVHLDVTDDLLSDLLDMSQTFLDTLVCFIAFLLRVHQLQLHKQNF